MGAARQPWRQGSRGGSFGGGLDIVAEEDEARFRDLMQAHHSLGAVSGMGETVLRYVAHFGHPLLLLESLHGPGPFPGHRLPCCQLDRGRAHPRLRSRGARLQRTRAAQACVPSSPVPDRAGPAPGGPSRPHPRHGVPKTMPSTAQMRSLPAFFQDIDDPRRRQGRRHALPTVLALATAATLRGMRGYKAISEWVGDLSPKALQRIRVRRRDGCYRPPGLSAIRSLPIRVDPAQLDAASSAVAPTICSPSRATSRPCMTISGPPDQGAGATGRNAKNALYALNRGCIRTLVSPGPARKISTNLPCRARAAPTNDGQANSLSWLAAPVSRKHSGSHAPDSLRRFPVARLRLRPAGGAGGAPWVSHG